MRSSLVTYLSLFALLTTISKEVLADDPPAAGSGGQAMFGDVTVKPGTAPPQQPQSRRQGNGAAKAMAAAAAAMQGMTCMMMMKKAQEEQDPQMKQMMMMMAMQQCAQAAQSAQNAADNDKGEKANMSQPTEGKEPELKVGQFKAPETPKDQGLNKDLTDTKAEEADDFQAPEYPVAKSPEVPTYKADVVNNAAKPIPPLGKGPPSTTVPKSIESAKLGYEEGGKKSFENGPDSAQAAGLLNPNTGKPPTPAEAVAIEKAKFDPDSYSSGGRMRKLGEGEANGSGGGGGSSSDSEKGSSGGSPIDAMLAMLGGGAQQGGGAMGGGDVLSFKANQEGGTAPNIFEYATFRYKKVAYEENKVDRKGKHLTTRPTTTVNAGIGQ